MFHNEDATLVKGITLNVKNLEKMKNFYEYIIGLSLKSESTEQVVLEVGNSGHTITLNLLENGREPGIREADLFHIALLLPTTTDLADFLLHASRLGIHLGAGDHIVSEALYLNDPEGNGIEIYRDRDYQDWKWNDGNVLMDTLEVDSEALIKHASIEGWKGMPPEGKIGHLHLKTDNIELSKSFYLDELGLEVVVGNMPSALFMASRKYHHHIAINTWQSNTKRKDSEKSYGLTKVSMQIPESKHKVLTSPEGITFEINNAL